jgi:hypothetical protein
MNDNVVEMKMAIKTPSPENGRDALIDVVLKLIVMSSRQDVEQYVDYVLGELWQRGYMVGRHTDTVSPR